MTLAAVVVVDDEEMEDTRVVVVVVDPVEVVEPPVLFLRMAYVHSVAVDVKRLWQ